MDFKNLNNYSQEYQKAKIYVNNQIRIERIYEYLNKNSTKEELKITIDVIKDIKKSNARTLIDAKEIENQAKFYKFLIDTFYPNKEEN